MAVSSALSFRPSILNVIAFILLCITWASTLYVIKNLQPTYQSAWAILIPGTRTTSSFKIDSIGEANTRLGSPYSKHAPDPKVNYKIILLSDRVLNTAASRTGLTREAFGLPQVTLPNQTSIFAATTKANTPELALRKAKILYEVFIEEINNLRSEERRGRDKGIASYLRQYELEVEKARSAHKELQQSSAIVSSIQYKSWLTTLAKLKERKFATQIQLEALQQELSALQNTLGTSPKEAMLLIKLRQDSLLQSLANDYTSKNTESTELAATLGNRNPKLVIARAHSQHLYAELLSRASSVIAQPAAELISLTLPDKNYIETGLYQSLVSLESAVAGIRSELAVMDQILPEIEKNTIDFSVLASEIDNLESNYRVARTVHATAKTRLSLAKSDYSGSYPLIQPFIDAVKPLKPSKLEKIAIVASALIVSMFLVGFMIVVFFRSRWLKRHNSIATTTEPFMTPATSVLLR